MIIIFHFLKTGKDIDLIQFDYIPYPIDILLFSIQNATMPKTHNNVILLFEKFEENINPNKLNDYFVAALKMHNFPLVLWLAKKNITHKCFIKEFLDLIKECPNNEKMDECIQSGIDDLYDFFLQQANIDCLELIIKIGIQDYDINFISVVGGNTDLLTLAFKANNDFLINWALNNLDINVNNVYVNHDGKNSLIYGIENANNDAVIKLINKGIELDRDIGTLQPLELAVSKHNIEIVNYLLEKGANVNLQSKYDRTALFSAAALGYLDIAKILIKYNADPNIVDKYNVSPLIIAAEKHHTSMIKYLVNETYADININPKYNDTVLNYAIKNVDLDLIKFLLDHGAVPNTKSRNGELILINVLMYFPKRKSDVIIETLKLLLKHGVKINEINDIYNMTVLMYAVNRSSRLSVIEFLLKSGADPKIKNAEGKTAFDFIQSYDSDMQNLLKKYA